jgi:acetate kinase
MEGSAFELDPELIRFFPEDKAKTLKAADELTRHALLKGPELYLLDQMQYGVRSTEYGENSEKRDAVRRAPQPKRSGAASVGSAVPVVAYGIEELQSYRANGVAFAEVLRAQQKTGQFLADMNMQVERLSSHYLNKDLRDFLRRVEGFEKNQIPLDTWLANLKGEAAKRLEIDLASPSYQLEWPMMVRISKIQELRAKFDKQKFSKERDEFLKSIRRFLPGNVERGTLNDPLSVTRSPFPAIESLLRNDSMSQQLPDPETGLLFEDMIKYLPENFNYDAFPNVRFFIGMLLLQSELKSGMLMQEIQKLSEKITTKLTRNKEEAKLVALLADHRLLQKLFALELAPEDYEKIERRKAEGVRSKNTTDGKGQKGYSLKPSELVRQLMGTESTSASRANDQRGTPYALHRTKQVEFSHIPDLDQLFDLAMQFYAGVKERDTFMMQRVEERLKETGATQVAVITGGFHSAPFQKYFTDKKYTYALISPRITGADEAGHQSYIQNTLMSTAKELRGTSYSVRRAEQATRESVSLADSQVLAPKNVYGVDQAAMRAEVREIIAGVRRSETRSPDDAERVREAEHALQEEAPHQVQATPQDAADVDYWNKHGKQEFYAGIDEPLRSRSEARLSQDSFEVPVSRRDFLRTAALATAGFFLLPAGTARAVGTNGVPTTPAKVSVRTGDRRLFIQDRKSDGTLGAEYALTMKGMNWSPASKDSNPTSNPTGFRDEFFKWYQTDIPLMAKMGVNVVRVYHDFGTDTRAFQVLDMFYKYGIKVIVQVDSPLHGTVANTANVTTVVNAYKNHPAILMWGIGNEWDLKMSNGKYYWTFNTLSDAAAWVQSTALTIKSLDSNHAVSTMMADPHIPDLHPLSQEAFPYQFSPSTLLTISTKDIVNTLCPAVDVWGLQIYRNKSFGDLFQQWRSISTKPMYIGEFGADSYDHLTGNQNYAMQADMNAGLWDETFLDLSAERTNGAAIGAVSFEFNDEWWKNGTPGVQSISYESNPGQPDSVNDEEHFGHFTIDRVQKTSATAISNRFNNGPAAVALNASPLLTVSSQDQGSAVIKIGDKTVFSRGGGQWGARGINVFVLDEATGIRVKEFRSFDTYVYPNLFTNLVSYLNGLPSGSIVAFSIADEGGLWREPWRADGGYPEPNALSFKTLLGSSAWGSTQVGNVRYQSGWAFLAKKGAGKLDEGISVAAYTTATVQYSPALTTNVSTGLRTAYAQVQPFQVKGAQLVGANAEVQFASVNGVVYQVEYSNDLKTWYVARSGIIAEGAVTTFVDDGTFTGAAPNTVPKRFYRVKATGQVFRSEARSSLRTSPGGIVKNTKNGTVSVRSEARVWSEADSLGDIETEVARVVAKNVQQDTNQVYDGMLRDFGMTTIDMTILELALESKFGFPTHSLDGLVNPSASVRAISGEIFSRLQSRSPRSEPRAEKDGEKLPSLDTFLRYIAKNMSDPKQKRQREMFLRKDSLSEVEFLIRQLQDHPDRFGLDSDDRKLLELMLRDLIHPRGEVTYFLDRFLDIGIHIKFNPSLLLAAIHAFVETGEVEELKKIPPASRSESRSPDDAERVREAEHVLREKSPRPIQQTPQDAADVDYWNKHGKQGFYAGIDESLSGRSEARSFIEEQAARYETLFADGKPVLAFEDVDLKTPGELDLSKGVAFTYREDSRQFVLRTANGRLGVTIRSVDGGEMNYISTGDSAKNPIAFTGDGARVLLKGHFLFAWSGSRKATGQSLTLVDLVNQNVLYSGESSKFGAENPEMSRLRSEMRKVLEDGEVLKPGQSQSAPVLVFNAGSSTIKWQVIDMATEVMIAKGKVDIGSGEGKAANYDEAIARILGELSERHLEPVAVGHRVVHGGESFKQPAIVSDPVIAAIEQVTELAPLHNPANLMCIRAAQKAFPKVGHVAVFDTAFHQTMPPKAFRYAIPNEYYTDHKVRKYGFHGTSHRYVMEEFARIQGKKPEDVSVVTAHLGNGASIAAIQNGKSIDTSMGLTPLEGVAMGTRSGDIDAGAVLYLANKLGKTPSQMSDLLNKQSGLKGLAGISDVQDLTRKANAGDEAAILALEIFIYRVLKYIYAYDGILGGADAIILTGGVGENHNYVHPRLLQRLSEYFQATRRPEKMPWIGSIKTNEELVIARDTLAVLSVAGLMSVAAQDVASRSESRGEDKETAEQKAIREFRVKFERQVNRVAAEGISQIKSLEGYNPEDPWAIAIQVSLNGNAPQSEPGITLEHVDQTGFYALSFLDVLWQGSFAHRIFSFDSILPVLDVKRLFSVFL